MSDTAAEMLQRMRGIASDDDQEEAHIDGDKLLLDVIAYLAEGLEPITKAQVDEIVRLWTELDKWYA